MAEASEGTSGGTATLRRFLTRSRYDLRTLCGASSPLFSSIYSMRSFTRQHLVGPDTEICIEGFPRSANSYAVLSFAKAQDRSVRIAHHLHVAAQIERAVRWRVPAMVLIRHPLDAAASLMVRHPALTPRQVLRAYIAFHRQIERWRDHFVLVSFDEATNDLGRAIDRVNARFGTNFRRPAQNDQDDELIFRMLDRINATQGTACGEHAVSRPSAMRRSRKAEIQTLLTAAPLKSLLREADAIYEETLAQVGMTFAHSGALCPA